MNKIFSMKKIISLVVMVIMLFNLSTTASAASTDDILAYTILSKDISAAREAYYALDSEAKDIFDATLINNSELLEFHRTYVDANFVAKTSRLQIESINLASADTLTVLMNDLNRLNLPTTVLYSLQAMGAGMVAAIADGPLPVGDILLAAATVSAAIVIAANWDTVSLVWDNIINAFKNAFKTSASNIINAFSTIKADSEKEVSNNKPRVDVSGKVLTLDGVKYYCNTRADQLTAQQKNSSRYYPAVLLGGYVWVDTVHPIEAAAKVIMFANNPYAGVWATKQSYAQGLCGGPNAIWHNTHNSAEGYFYHYHHPAFKNFHCWYL